MGIPVPPGVTRRKADALYGSSGVDFCVYGATAGGIVAAIKAAQLGLKVELICPDTVFGGMPTRGGLAYTDRAGSDVNVFKGITNDIYRAIWLKYYSAAAATYPIYWAQSLNGDPAYLEAELRQRMASAGVTVRNNLRVRSVEKSGTVATTIVFEDSVNPTTAPPLRVTAKQFVDAGYEGDLIAAANCLFTVGRESNAQYGESYNGVYPPYNFNWEIDPYITPGVSSSGLLPGVSAALPANGTGDNRVQAYSHRVSVVSSTGTSNSYRPFPEPEVYNPLLYEALGRQFAKGSITAFADSTGTYGVFNAQQCKGGITDLNQGVGCLAGLDFVTHADSWPTGAPWVRDDPATVGGEVNACRRWSTDVYAVRAQLMKDHVNYTLGLFKFLKTDPRVPAAVKQQLALYGLPPIWQLPTPFGIPSQLYVREARRLVGDFVQLDKHMLRMLPVNDGICVAFYAMDSHHCQYGVVNGYIATEGGFYVKTGATTSLDGRSWISKRVILPKRIDCTNLSALFALSASHASFASLRLEPICMQLGEAAAIMADQAIKNNVALHDVPSRRVREAMGYFHGGGIVLDVPPGAYAPGTYVDADGNGRIVVVGVWAEATTLGSTSEGSIYGPTQLTDNGVNKGGSVSFEFALAKPGVHTPRVFFAELAGLPTNVPVDVIAGGVLTSLTFSQQASGNWQPIPGTFAFTANDPANNKIVIRNAGTVGIVKVDAAQLVYQY